MPTKQDHPPRDRAQFLCDTAGSILTVYIRGEIDHHTSTAIRQGIDGVLFEKRPHKLVLDLSAVSFMDSSGLGLIMGRYSVMKELEGEMTVRNPSRETRSILTLAGMERLVRIEYPHDSPPDQPSVRTREPDRRPRPEGGSSTGRRKAVGSRASAKKRQAGDPRRIAVGKEEKV